MADHAEPILTGEWLEPFGKSPTNTICPCRHCGHCSKGTAGEVFEPLPVVLVDSRGRVLVRHRHARQTATSG